MDPRSTDLWAYQRTPGRFDAQEDQELNDPALLPSFKNSLLAESRETYTDYLGASPAELLLGLTTPSDSRPAFPINYFDSVDKPPTRDELSHLGGLYVTTLHSELHFLNEIPHGFFSLNDQCLALSIASLGSIRNGDISSGVYLCSLASRLLIAGLAIDNRKVRKNHAILSGLIQETVGALTHDASTWRTTNNVHGIINVVVIPYRRMMKNIYSNGVKQNIQYERSLLAYALLIDTVRSLHFGMPATIASSLADVPFPSQQSSFSQLLSATIFGFPKALWLPYSEENALLLLLLIFSEEQIWKTKMIHGTIPAGFPGDDARSNSLAYMKSIQRALNRWKVEYFDRTTSEIKALYQFCEIYLLLRNLENLPDMMKYREQHNGVPELSQVHIMSNEEEQNRAKASHHAWLLLEHVSACSKSNAVWLPIILYLSGLVVWYDINSRQGSRSHGSMMVLNLFVKELRGMQWPCCIDMATNLEKLQ